MKRTMGGAALLAAAVALAPMPANAQAAPPAPRDLVAPWVGPGVELVLRQRERLELTEDQVRQLDQIRQEVVARRTAHQTELAGLRSEVRAGQTVAAELRERVQAQRQAAQESRTQERERVEAILTDAQKQQLQTWGAAARGFAAGRRTAVRGAPGWGPCVRPGLRPAVGMRGRVRPWVSGAPAWGLRRDPGPEPGTDSGFGPPADSVPR